MFCIGYTDTLTMSVPLQVLKIMGADFDGDKYIKIVTLIGNNKKTTFLTAGKC